jgi:hypothetical protein
MSTFAYPKAPNLTFSNEKISLLTDLKEIDSHRVCRSGPYRDLMQNFKWRGGYRQRVRVIEVEARVS